MPILVLTPPIACNFAALMIAMIYYSWRDSYHHKKKKDDKVLRERVAYMLWHMAQKCA